VLSITLFGTTFSVGIPFLLVLAAYATVGSLREAAITLLCVAAHEIAHVLVASAYGLEVESVELFPFGGVARVSGVMEHDPHVETSIALAGPASSFFLAGLSAALWRSGRIPDAGMMVDFNLLLGGMNLLPALPLDGGRIVRAYLSARSGFRSATETVARAGRKVALALFAVAVASAYYGYHFPNLIIMAVFIYALARLEEHKAAFAFLSFIISRKQQLARQSILPTENLTAMSTVTLERVAHSFSARRYSTITVLDQDLRPVGHVTEAQVIEAILSGEGRSTLGDLVRV
jgi:stage IV sporulation protein FB